MLYILFCSLIFCVVAIMSASKVSKADYVDYGGASKIKGKIDALNYIYSDAKGKPFGLFVFSPPVYTYPYEYLIK